MSFESMELRSARTPSNGDRAVLAFLSLHGGIEGYIASGREIEDLYSFFKADDELLRESGILDIADIMDARQKDKNTEINLEKTDEPLISPETARAWVIDTKRATELEGKLIASCTDHIGLAGVEIANGTEARYLTDVYSEVSQHEAPLSDEIVADIARKVAENY